ncbi:50S ribosomal protein L21 [Roseobacter sp. N2S]|uniref:50S ribosomal protein L21 n=1 Tax=Roseobacter sp. N2S TaxID=2663844 RepID=UPI00286066A0|nr:50S ribosomal protein L21 [Roseobacter sp. N2S]MDR6265316.1 large subunit ribosomal protein L21 [Roseobacter sp. N2S]
MFAVVKTGGKQYKVVSGDVLKIEKIAGNAGETVQFNEVLMLGGDSTTVGTPTVAGAGVQAEILEQAKGPKVINYVKRRRKHSSQRKKGHRQQLTVLRVTDILASGADKSGVMAAVNGAGFVVAPVEAAPKKAKADKKAAPKAAKKSEAKAETAAPAVDGADDLKKLSGVGPALEKKLNAAGVTSFAQIAAWGEADIAEFDEKLSFKGRIEREGWVDQAKELTKG